MSLRIPKVSMVRVTVSVQQAVREAMELADWRHYITPGADVSLKVNLGWDLFLPGLQPISKLNRQPMAAAL